MLNLQSRRERLRRTGGCGGMFPMHLYRRREGVWLARRGANEEGGDTGMTQVFPPIQTSPDSRMSLTVEELRREHDKHAKRLAYYTFNRDPEMIREREAEICRHIRVALWVKQGKMR
jgi:hypothetical protein